MHHRSVRRPKILRADRALWGLLARIGNDWKQALVFVRPEMVLRWRWQRKRLKEHWTKLSRQGNPGWPHPIILFGGRHLRRVLRSYVEYYNRCRMYLSPDMDSPNGRPPQ